MFTYSSVLRYQEKLAQKLKEINQPIRIRDIYLKPENQYFSSGEYGEGSHKNKYPTQKRLKRLKDHIALLAQITNKTHQNAYCVVNEDKKFEIRKDCANKITRLLLNEFSFYTRKPPLSEKDFGWLIEQIEEIAKIQHENVHLLLSSLPLSTKDNKLLNVALYVECGEIPHIKMIVKAFASSSDLYYIGSSPFSKDQYTYHEKDKVTYSNFSITPVALDDPSFAIPTDSVFTVTTQGGAQYIQALDICFDHEYKYAKKLTATAINSSTNQDTTFIPDQVDQVLSSNCITIKDSAKISDEISHVDPKRKYQYPISSIPLFEAPAIPDEYTETSVEIENNSRMKIKNPPFSSNYTLIAAPERKLTHLKKELKDVVTKRNNTLIKQDVLSRTHLTPHTPFKKLFKELLSDCVTSFCDRLFEINNYSVKQKAKKLLIHFQEKTNKILLKIVKYDDLVKELNSSLNELKYQLDRLTIHENSFINQLIMKINSTQDHLFSPTLKPSFLMRRRL